MAKAQAVKWTREHTLIALNLYCKLPFGQLHKGNPIIKEVAAKMGRPANSLAIKLYNLASLDPVQRARGVKGLEGASKQDRLMWNEFQGNLSVLGARVNNWCMTCSRKMKQRKWIFYNTTKPGLSRQLARPKLKRRSKFVAASNSSGKRCSQPTMFAAASAASTCRACSWRATSSRGGNFQANASIRKTAFAFHPFTTQRLTPDLSRSTTG